jgi:hypothetical protein
MVAGRRCARAPLQRPSAAASAAWTVQGWRMDAALAALRNSHTQAQAELTEAQRQAPGARVGAWRRAGHQPEYPAIAHHQTASGAHP